jgi:fibronectin type 3 domain-containing protein
MALGLSSCTANVFGSRVCNVVVVQRVINASLPGGSCVTGTGGVAHSVSLNWGASVSPGVTAYKVYRGMVTGGPYTLLSTLGVATSFTDNNVQSGQTYYYVVTALNSGGESPYSNQAQAVIPVP